MTKTGFISTLTLSALIVLPVAAKTGNEAITAAQIAGAISDAGIKVSADQVTLLSDVVSRTASPALKVEGMERLAGHRLRVRLDCSKPEECLPFYVIVRADESGAETFAPPLVQSSSAISPARQPASTFAVRAGAPAVLLLEGSHVHIQLSVVCLENGAPGQTIRVASPDRRRTYMAEVVDGTTLRGRL